MASLALAAFLVGHALIHLGFVSPRPPATPGGPPWPFDLGRSWLVGRGAPRAMVRGVAAVLLVVSLSAYAAAALGILGILAPGTVVPAVVAGTVASLALLIGAFHPWLVIGIGIDVVLLWVTTFAGWTPEVLG
jgi:hypothetical protein